jgi:hypothetical protein
VTRLSQMRQDWQVRLHRFFAGPLGPDAKPLEIRESVLDAIEDKVEPVGRGRRVFPYSRIAVRVIETNANKAALTTTFDGLDARVRERLRELRCEVPNELDVRTVVLKKAPHGWMAGQLFAIDCQAETKTAEDEDTPQRPTTLRITVVKGQTSEQTYTFTEPLVSIGRTADPADHTGRVRRNHVAFLETVDGTTETVGRGHARFVFDSGRREYRLFDEGSSNGTVIVRAGVSLRVPHRDPRGVRVHSGDEIHLGRAVLRIDLE